MSDPMQTLAVVIVGLLIVGGVVALLLSGRGGDE